VVLIATTTYHQSIFVSLKDTYAAVSTTQESR
jgi:hypothetical protein